MGKKYNTFGKIMTDNGTLRDHLADVINERNELLRKVETMQARLDELSRQLAALWKVDND
jgi:cell division septum initiation protein DivIVA